MKGAWDRDSRLGWGWLGQIWWFVAHSQILLGTVFITILWATAESLMYAWGVSLRGELMGR